MKHLLSSALVLLSAAGLASAASVFSLDSDDAMKKSAGILAHDMLFYYKGNESGGTPGILPGPPPGGDYYWWEAGAMWGTLIEYWALTGDSQYNDIIMQAMLFQVGEKGAYMPRNVTLSLGNDDQAFWGMAALLAAENKFPDPPSDKPSWLALAQAVFNTQASPDRHDDTCGGGLRWQIPPTNNGYGYKNSIANGCFFNMGARLARYTGNKTYSDWAEKTWDWVEKVEYIDPKTWYVYDGANVGHDCKDINPVQYSYNNAIFAQGAAFMYAHTKDEKWKDRTEKLVTAGLKQFFPDGIATEISCEPNNGCKVDMFTYKGFVHRWYATIVQLIPDMKGKIADTLKKSAAAGLAQCTGGDNGRQCGIHWADGKYDGKTGAGQEMSALAAVQSLLMLEGKAPVTEKTGGTSKGDPNAGSGAEDILKKFKPVTVGDKVGASILTVLVAGMACGMFGWMSFDLK